MERAAVADISEPTGRLLNQVGLLLKSKALHAQAEPLYRRALATKEKSPGPECDVAFVSRKSSRLQRRVSRCGAKPGPVFHEASRMPAAMSEMPTA
jgi:hypothetical protein